MAAYPGAVRAGSRDGPGIFQAGPLQIDPVFEGSTLTTFRTTIGKKITQDLS